jgi:hypothetical protein
MMADECINGGVVVLENVKNVNEREEKDCGC